MCSICGSTHLDKDSIELIANAKERGSDYFGLSQYSGAWIANCRATPTTEAENAENNQPFGSRYKIVHNGTISNDKELGIKEGEIDSVVLARCLNVDTEYSIRDSLKKVVGSYAIAILKPNNELFLACNYKPLWFSVNADVFSFSSYKEHLKGNPQRVPPYSVMNVQTGNIIPIKRTQPNRAIIIHSGGLDSTAVIGYAQKQHDEILLLHFDYGCKATAREIKAVKAIAKEVGCESQIINIDYSMLKGDSPLLSNTKTVSKGIEGAEYAHEWVPARNLLLLSYSVAYAEANKYGYVYLGTNLEEGGAYPDNEEQFIRDFNSCLYGAVQNGIKVEIRTPLGNLMKKDIVLFGETNGSPLHLSYSCYIGEEEHCGECGPCFMRKTAYNRAGVKDPTAYKKG